MYNDKHIEYKLCIIRMLADSYRTIDFSKESKGNHQLLRLLCYLLTACFGGIVVLDEADSGIHDLLFKKIITTVILGFIIYVFAQYALYDKVQKECLKTSAQDFWREISNFCKAW